MYRVLVDTVSSSKITFQVGPSQDDDVFVETKAKHHDDDSLEDASSLNIGTLALAERDEADDVPLSLMHIDAQNIYPPTACLFAAK